MVKLNPVVTRNSALDPGHLDRVPEQGSPRCVELGPSSRGLFNAHWRLLVIICEGPRDDQHLAKVRVPIGRHGAHCTVSTVASTPRSVRLRSPGP